MKSAIKLWSTIILVLIFVQHSHGSSSTLTDSLVSMLSSSFASHGESPLSGRSLKSDIDFGAGFGDESSSRDDNNLNLGSFRQLSLASTQPFIQRRLFNTSVALTIPIFSFTLPQRASQGSTVDLANQTIFGLFALLVTMLVFTVPVLFTGVRPTVVTGRKTDDGGTQGILNNLMASNPVFNLMGADMQHKIGLDTTKCLQKTICEAHRAPRNKNYGLLALPFQIFFPPTEKTSSKSTSSAFQLAAGDGKYSKVDCGEKFRCFFDLLDLFVYLVDWYKYRSEMGENINNA